MEDVAEKLHTLIGLASSSDRSTTEETGIGILWIEACWDEDALLSAGRKQPDLIF
jgi:hypothetical protein